MKYWQRSHSCVRSGTRCLDPQHREENFDKVLIDSEVAHTSHIVTIFIDNDDILVSTE